jgi:Na+-translocating ferredoxin:NAD+ oxidoreductase RnfD subunit
MAESVSGAAADVADSVTITIGTGIGCGVITCVIRFYANYAEGVSFSILIMNILTPYIDRFTETKPLGAKTREDTKANADTNAKEGQQ